MVHLPPLPGSPGFGGQFSRVIDAARRDAMALAAGGCDAIMVENFGDIPFFPGRVPAETVAAMAVAVDRIKIEAGDLPIGVNVLRNDARSALAIAAAVDAQFVRVNVLCGARVTDQGIIEGDAATVLRDRARLAANCSIWADVDVKHSAPLAKRSLAEEVADTVARGMADALIVSGSGTGQPTASGDLVAVRDAAPAGTPVLVGSGASVETLADLRPHCDGLIVGTAFKPAGQVREPVDVDTVRDFANRLDA